MTATLHTPDKDGACCDECEKIIACDCEAEEWCVRYIIPSSKPWSNFEEYSYTISREWRDTGMTEIITRNVCQWSWDEALQDTVWKCEDQHQESAIYAWVDVKYETRYKHTTFETLDEEANCVTNTGRETSLFENTNVYFESVKNWMTTELSKTTMDMNSLEDDNHKAQFRQENGLDENAEGESMIRTLSQADSTPIDLGCGSWVQYWTDGSGNIEEEGLTIKGVFMMGWLENGTTPDNNCFNGNNLSEVCISEGYWTPHRCAGWTGDGGSANACSD
jgi:hypothetical protein